MTEVAYYCQIPDNRHFPFMRALQHHCPTVSFQPTGQN